MMTRSFSDGSLFWFLLNCVSRRANIANQVLTRSTHLTTLVVRASCEVAQSSVKDRAVQTDAGSCHVFCFVVLIFLRYGYRRTNILLLRRAIMKTPNAAIKITPAVTIGLLFRSLKPVTGAPASTVNSTSFPSPPT